jgi:hypothetical protein
MTRPKPATEGERLPAATATPAIQTASSKAIISNIQDALPDSLRERAIYIPRLKARKLRKYSTADHDILYLHTQPESRSNPAYYYLGKKRIHPFEV